MVNQIGPFRFLFLRGSPVPPMPRPRLIQRAGVDGTGIWKTGTRGKLFTLRAEVDAPFMSTAREFFVAVVTLIEQAPVVLIQGDYDYNDRESWKVVLIGVREVKRHAVGAAQGGLYPPSLAWLELDIDMVAIAN